MTNLHYVLLLYASALCAQPKISISGTLNSVNNQEIMLSGFSANGTFILDKNQTDTHGNFKLSYPARYVGAALLEIKNSKKVIVLLNGENFVLHWADLTNLSSLKFTNSFENSAFEKGLATYQDTENKKSGLTFLMPFYQNEPQKLKFFTDELQVLNNSTSRYIDQLPSNSYVKYYLNIRVLIANLSLSSTRYFDRLPELEKTFNELNFADERLLQSGLYTELLDAYVVAMESYGDNQYAHLNAGINAIIASLKSQPTLAQNITEYLFNVLEKRSLYQSSEYLALAMLSNENCQLDDKHKALFEQYRKMANGQTAPNITFSNTKSPIKQLSDVKSKYKLVVFGASWCPKCLEDIPKLTAYYSKWKTQKDLEIIYISLDTNKTDFDHSVNDYPWISSSDFKGWETQAALDYSVFSTPIMYLLDHENKIVLKPISADQVDTWLGN